MNKFSLKQELFREIIKIILEQWHDVNEELYVCSQKKPESQESFFNRLIAINGKNASYKKPTVSNIKKNGFPEKFFTKFISDRDSMNSLCHNIGDILKNEFNESCLAHIAERIKDYKDNSQAAHDIKELKTPDQFSSKDKYIVNAVRKSLEYVITDQSPAYKICSERPRKIHGFIGRSEEIKEIDDFLADRNYAVISGIGGIGKTFLAREYLAEHSSEYDIISTVRFDTNISTTISNIECEGMPDNMKPSQRKAEIQKLLKQAGNKAIVFIDSLDDKGKDYINDETYWEKIVETYKCRFLVTTRMASNSAIKLSELSDSELGELFNNQLNNRKQHCSFFRDNLSDLLEILHRHTLLVELSGKVFDKLDMDPTEFMEIMRGEDPQYPSDRVELKKDQSTSRKSVSDHLDTLFSLAGLSEFNKRMLMDFSLLSSDAMINVRTAERWFSPYCKDDFEEMSIFGWLQSSYDENQDSYKYGIHSLIAETIRRNNAFINCDFRCELRNVESYSYNYYAVGNRALAEPLYSIVTKVKAKSRELRFCKSRVCFCLSYIGRKDLAYAIYQVSDDKLDFTNDVYGWLKQFSDNDPQLKSIIQSKENEYDQGELKDNDCIDELIEFNNEKVYHEIISKSPCKKLRYDDRFIRTRLMTADRYFSELKFAELPKCTKGLRMLIFSYHSPEAFYSIPSDVDGNAYLKFILEQFSCSRIEDTIFYKTVAGVSEVGTEYNGVVFYNDIYALKSMLIYAAHVETMYQTQFAVENTTTNASKWFEFLAKNRKYISTPYLIEWDIHLAYCLCNSLKFDLCDRIVEKYRNISFKEMPKVYDELRILESYIKCYKCIDSFDGSSLKMLSDKLITYFDGIVNLIISQKKALKANNVSELNLLLTAMRAIVMVCSSKEELNLKASVSKFVKIIEERDKIDTRLTVSEDYFTSLLNAYNNFKAEIKGTLCTPQIAHSEKNN